ncbi:MAG TPA: LapA family protein [Micromonosporaceae bacterium]
MSHLDPPGPSETPRRPGRAPRTRTATAWFGACTVAAALVVPIVFVLQNTRSVDVTFLWMHGYVPLALALLIAGVGVAVLAIAVGATTRVRSARAALALAATTTNRIQVQDIMLAAGVAPACAADSAPEAAWETEGGSARQPFWLPR